MTSRRKFFRYSLFGIGAVSVANVGYSMSGARMPEAIQDILYTDLKGLNISPAHIKNYAQELADKNHMGFKFTTAQLIILYKGKSNRLFRLPFNRKYNQIRTDIVSNFLLSTDFFTNKMNADKVVRYSGSIYKPYESACLNPFSGLYFQN